MALTKAERTRISKQADDAGYDVFFTEDGKSLAVMSYHPVAEYCGPVAGIDNFLERAKDHDRPVIG